MIGVVVIVLLIVIVLPVMLMLTGSIVALILGTVLKDNGEATHPGSELIDLNR